MLHVPHLLQEFRNGFALGLAGALSIQKTRTKTATPAVDFVGDDANCDDVLIYFQRYHPCLHSETCLAHHGIVSILRQGRMNQDPLLTATASYRALWRSRSIYLWSTYPMRISMPLSIPFASWLWLIQTNLFTFASLSLLPGLLFAWR